MPEFVSGEAKTAVAVMSNPTTKAFVYLASLYLGVNKAVSKDVSFSLNPAEAKDIRFPIVMPSPGTYPVYLDVYSGGVLLSHYQAVDDVVVTEEITYGATVVIGV